MYKRVCSAVLLMLAIITEPGVAARPDAKIEVAIEGETRSFTQTALLARADAERVNEFATPGC